MKQEFKEMGKSDDAIKSRLEGMNKITRDRLNRRRYEKAVKSEKEKMSKDPDYIQDIIDPEDFNLASGGIAGQLHLNQGGRIGFRLGKGPGQRIQKQEILNERIRHFFEQQLPHEDQPINREVNQSFLDALQGQDKGTTGLRYRGEVVEFDDGTVYYKDTGEYYKQDGTQVEGPSEGAKIIPETIEVKEGGKVSSGLAHILGV